MTATTCWATAPSGTRSASGGWTGHFCTRSSLAPPPTLTWLDPSPARFTWTWIVSKAKKNLSEQRKEKMISIKVYEYVMVVGMPYTTTTTRLLLMLVTVGALMVLAAVINVTMLLCIYQWCLLVLLETHSHPFLLPYFSRQMSSHQWWLSCWLNQQKERFYSLPYQGLFNQVSHHLKKGCFFMLRFIEVKQENIFFVTLQK